MLWHYLTFKWLGWILILAHGLWKTNVKFEKKEIKLWNKQHFVKNKTEIMQHVLKMQ
jgi:hypothetical protein